MESMHRGNYSYTPWCNLGRTNYNTLVGSTTCKCKCTTDVEVIYSRDVGGHNIMKIFTERVYCQRNRKDVEETHEAQKISCLLQKVQKRPWKGMGGL